MTNKQQMQAYMSKVKATQGTIESINKVVLSEVSRRHGSKIQRARTAQERDNLQEFYRQQVAAENMWLANAKGDRSLYIQLAQMHGIAAMLDEVEEDRPQRDSL